MSTLLLLATLVLAPVIGGGFGDLTNAILEILVFVAVVLYAARPRPHGWARVPGLWALLAFFLLVIVSSFFTECIYCSLRQTIFLAACLGAYVLAGTLCRDKRVATAAVWGITLAALGISVEGIQGYAISSGGGAQFWKALLGHGSHWRLFGTFINPGFFAGFLVIALPVATALYLVTRRTTFAALAGVAVVFEALALMLTGTKFAVLAAAGALMVMFALAIATRAIGRAQFRRIVVMAIVLAPLLVLFSGPVRHRIEQAESGGSEAHSTAFRFYAWRSTVSMIRDHPLLGVGPGVYEIAYPRYAIAGPTKYAHESYLQIGAEAGVPALVAFLAGLAAILFGSLRGIRNEQRAQGGEQSEEDPGEITWSDLVPPDGWRLLNSAIFAALIGSCARNLVDSDWFVIGIALPSCVLAGVLVARAGAAKGSMSPAKGLRVVLMVVGVATILLTGSFGLGDYFAPDQLQEPRSGMDLWDRYCFASLFSPLNPGYHRDVGRLGVIAAGGDLGKAAEELDTAIRLAPTDASNYQVRGVIAMGQNDPKAAISFFEEALNYNPNSTQTLYQLALAHQAMGDIQSFESTLKRLPKIEHSTYEQVRGVPELVDLTYVRAHEYFGNQALARKQFARAAAEFEAATERLERWRSNKDVREMQLATGALTKDEVRQTLDLLRQLYSRLADAYSGMGDTERALATREEALSIEH